MGDKLTHSNHLQMPAFQIPLELRHRIGLAITRMFLTVQIPGAVTVDIDLNGLLTRHVALLCSRELVLFFDAHTGRGRSRRPEGREEKRRKRGGEVVVA